MNAASTAAAQTITAARSQVTPPSIVKPSEKVGDDQRGERRNQRHAAEHGRA